MKEQNNEKFVTNNHKTISCAMLITSPSGWLLAHATRTPRWDLPKGKQEVGETALEAAIRETIEEIGIDINGFEGAIQDLGSHPYLPKKDLHLFRLDLPVTIDLRVCRCTSMVHRGNEIYPETDAYAWIKPEDIHKKVGKSLSAYLSNLGLIDWENPSDFVQYSKTKSKS